MRRFLERLAVFNRLILFDRRGSGLSDGLVTPIRSSRRLEDALAVLDAAGSERAALFTYGLGGPVGALLAAERPERVGALIMYASVARTSWAPDYDWAMSRENARSGPSAPSPPGVRPMAQHWRCWLPRWPVNALCRSGSRVSSAWPPVPVPPVPCCTPPLSWTCARHCPTSAYRRSSCIVQAIKPGIHATRAIWQSTFPVPAMSSSRGSTLCRSSATATRSSTRSRSS